MNRRNFFRQAALCGLATVLPSLGRTEKQLIFAKPGTIFDWKKKLCTDSRFRIDRKQKHAPLIFFNGRLQVEGSRYITKVKVGPNGWIERICTDNDGKIVVLARQRKNWYGAPVWQTTLVTERVRGAVLVARFRDEKQHEAVVKKFFAKFTWPPRGVVRVLS